MSLGFPIKSNKNEKIKEKMFYRKIMITEFGGPEVLQIVTCNNLPEPMSGQVRIKVLAASVTFTDTLIRRGIYPSVRKGNLPLTPGYDLVGIVDALGEGVENIGIGQRIAQLTVTGAYTEYICLDAETLVPVPDGIRDEQAISLVLTYVAAYQLLHRVAKVQFGQTVFIHAVGGAVGKALVQLGMIMNLKMYGTASLHHEEFIGHSGVQTIDYKTEDFEQILKEKEPQGVDAVFDPIGGIQLEKSLRILNKSGTLVDFGFQGMAQGKEGSVYLDFIKVLIWKILPWFPNAAFYDITAYKKRNPKFFTEDLQNLFQLLKDGKIKPNISKIVSFEGIQEAHRLVEQGKTSGKVILKPSSSQ
ncbi:medium chain dehydrogenase/reductase family protein [Chryseobacterium sp. R2ACT005]|uniref:medium chain dehydrogenase/reductase family protein n=1 Tax=Chryseobacterium sp. R2ACT005 TaxID=3416668 RepID=UPI003CF0AAD8